MQEVQSVNAVVIDPRVAIAPTTHAMGWYASSKKPSGVSRTRAFGYSAGFSPQPDHRTWVIV